MKVPILTTSVVVAVAAVIGWFAIEPQVHVSVSVGPQPALAVHEHLPPTVLTENEVKSVLAEAGWADGDISDALAVTHCESAWHPHAFHPHDGQYNSYGLFQLNGWWATDFVNPSFNNGVKLDLDQVYDPAYNAEYALAIWKNSGWEAWGCKVVL